MGEKQGMRKGGPAVKAKYDVLAAVMAKYDVIDRILENPVYTKDNGAFRLVADDLSRLSLSTLQTLETIVKCKGVMETVYIMLNREQAWTEIKAFKTLEEARAWLSDTRAKYRQPGALPGAVIVPVKIISINIP